MCTIVPRLVTVVVLCVHLLGVSSTQLESGVEKRSGAKYCGRFLADVIQLVCGGKYNVVIEKKSSGDVIPAEEFTRRDSDSEGGFWLQDAALEGLSLPFRPKYVATALVPGSFRRVTRGAHDECCRKSCTYQEIRTYCAHAPATLGPRSRRQWGE